MKALLEAGVHFGHRTPRWNPKMKGFIFTERKGIHIIDLQQTITRLEEAYNFVQDVASKGGTVLFVGTKRQAADSIRAAAERCGMPYVNQRWLGGTLTNFRTIRQRIEYLLALERRKAEGELERLPKKEAQKLDLLIQRLNVRLGGLKEMHKLPDAVFITDVTRETLAVKEADRLGIPIVAMVDTNGDPDPVDYCIPSNDDAIRAIRLVTGLIADAVIEGRQLRASLVAEEREEIEEVSLEEFEVPELALGEEELLGPSTLEKIRAQQVGYEVEELELEELEEAEMEEAVDDEGETEDLSEMLGPEEEDVE
ncbi:MAG: 30S ribosomal protein S2 [Anaerolineae bacterium]